MDNNPLNPTQPMQTPPPVAPQAPISPVMPASPQVTNTNPAGSSPKKSMGLMIWIVVGLLVVLSLGGLGYYFYSQATPNGSPNTEVPLNTLPTPTPTPTSVETLEEDLDKISTDSGEAEFNSIDTQINQL